MSKQLLKFEKVGTRTMREGMAEGVLPELEYVLLKGGGHRRPGRNNKLNQRSLDEGMRWSVEDKAVLLNMEIETLRARQGDMDVEVQVRSLCHSSGVTADYLETNERFNMKKIVLILGNVGKSAASWAELVQPAVFLHRHEFNVIWLEVPSFGINPGRWLKYGPYILRGVLRFMSIKQVAVIAYGLGGAVFLEALVNAPELFGPTHVVHNMDLPPSKRTTVPVTDLEDLFRSRELQIWFTYCDDEGAFDRYTDGSQQRAYDTVVKLQARMKIERRHSKRRLDYDEILITENLNEPMKPLQRHLETFKTGIYTVLAFSDPFLLAVSSYLEGSPTEQQEQLHGGLVGEHRRLVESEKSSLLNGSHGPGTELIALRRLRYAEELNIQSQERSETSMRNRRRVDRMQRATELLNGRPMLPQLGDGSPDSRGLGLPVDGTASIAVTSATSGLTFQTALSNVSSATTARGRRRSQRDRRPSLRQSSDNATGGRTLAQLTDGGRAGSRGSFESFGTGTHSRMTLGVSSHATSGLTGSTSAPSIALVPSINSGGGGGAMASSLQAAMGRRRSSDKQADPGEGTSAEAPTGRNASKGLRRSSSRNSRQSRQSGASPEASTSTEANSKGPRRSLRRSGTSAALRDPQGSPEASSNPSEAAAAPRPGLRRAGTAAVLTKDIPDIDMDPESSVDFSISSSMSPPVHQPQQQTSSRPMLRRAGTGAVRASDLPDLDMDPESSADFSSMAPSVMLPVPPTRQQELRVENDRLQREIEEMRALVAKEEEAALAAEERRAQVRETAAMMVEDWRLQEQLQREQERQEQEKLEQQQRGQQEQQKELLALPPPEQQLEQQPQQQSQEAQGTPSQQTSQQQPPQREQPPEQQPQQQLPQEAQGPPEQQPLQQSEQEPQPQQQHPPQQQQLQEPQQQQE